MNQLCSPLALQNTEIIDSKIGGCLDAGWVKGRDKYFRNVFSQQKLMYGRGTLVCVCVSQRGHFPLVGAIE